MLLGEVKMQAQHNQVWLWLWPWHRHNDDRQAQQLHIEPWGLAAAGLTTMQAHSTSSLGFDFSNGTSTTWHTKHVNHEVWVLLGKSRCTHTARSGLTLALVMPQKWLSAGIEQGMHMGLHCQTSKLGSTSTPHDIQMHCSSACTAWWGRNRDAIMAGHREPKHAMTSLG